MPKPNDLTALFLALVAARNREKSVARPATRATVRHPARVQRVSVRGVSRP